ncbi:ABC transporter ATP-binding protein [Demequina maris]|uniref:ABC transporter ATP-binding protein n=1 Tax=Demequina maris TaxID=1638982 RepID=UPI0007811312|nr:ATP-binding cassette domain-containing protein [Demequina maris]
MGAGVGPDQTRVRAGEAWRRLTAARWEVMRFARHGNRPAAAAMLALNVALGLLPAVFIVATSVLIGRVPAAVRDGLDSAAWDSLVGAFVVAGAALLGMQALSPVEEALFAVVRQSVDTTMRDRLMASTLAAPGVAAMEDQRVLDALATATADLDKEDEGPGAGAAGSIAVVRRWTTLASMAVLAGAAAGWWAGLAVGVVTGALRWRQRRQVRVAETAFAAAAREYRAWNYFSDLSMGPGVAKETRVFGLTGWLADRTSMLLETYMAPLRRIYEDTQRREAAVALTAGVAVLGGTCAAVGAQAAAGTLSLTAFALFLQSTAAAAPLGDFWGRCDSGTQSGLKHLGAVTALEQALEAHRDAPASAAPAGLPSDAPRRSLDLVGVSFRYPGADIPVLDGLDLRLEAGRTTAIVGVNGAGKTTLVKLLGRLHEPDTGSVEADGVDIAAMDVDAWRRHLSVVFQDFLRYELSARENIAAGAPEAPVDDAVVEQVAHEAGVLDALRGLERGLDTPLARAYDGGVDLSGGQWQRIAIARSLYALHHGARVLVLDEPTSALDVRAEAQFFDRFVDLTRGATTVLISHRFSSVRRADDIVVLDRGRIRERGSHADLVTGGGEYARLFALQAARFRRGLDAEGEPIDGEGAP